MKCPEQVCCGMPFLDGGDTESAQVARKNIASLKGAVERGERIVVPQPTCSYVLKNEYPLAALADPEKPARLSADNGRYRAEASLSALVRRELIRDLDAMAL